MEFTTIIIIRRKKIMLRQKIDVQTKIGKIKESTWKRKIKVKKGVIDDYVKTA